MAKKSGRRSNGEGSIVQRSDGRWTAAVTVPDTGKRKYVYGKTRAEVSAKLNEILAQINDGTYSEDSNMRFEEWLNYYLEEIAKPSLRRRTWDSYRSGIIHHVIPELGKIRLKNLKPSHIQSYLNKKLDEGHLSHRTVEYQRAVMRKALSEAERRGLVKRNVATLTSVPRREPVRIEPLTKAQARKLIDYLAESDEQYKAVIIMAVMTGMRQGELLGLKWQDVDFSRESFYVYHQLARWDNEYHLVDVKTDYSRRTLPMPKRLVDALVEWKHIQNQYRNRWPEKWEEFEAAKPEFRGLVFTTRYGTPVSPRNLYRRYKEILKELDLPDVRFHDLRHTAATIMLEEGVDLKTLSDVLGHSQIGITMNTYAHVSPSLRENAISKLAGAFDNND